MSDTKRISKRRTNSIRMKRANPNPASSASARMAVTPGNAAPVRMDRVMAARENIHKNLDAHFAKAIEMLIGRELDA